LREDTPTSKHKRLKLKDKLEHSVFYEVKTTMIETLNGAKPLRHFEIDIFILLFQQFITACVKFRETA
jgi:hypothetical protein